jgi:hypothetical protein
MRKQTWFAVVVCIILTLPGVALGGVVTLLYKALIASQIGAEPDPVFLRTVFGIQTPGLIMKWIAFNAMGSYIHGAVAGTCTVYATAWICKGANIEPAAYSTGGFYTAVVLLIFAIGISVDGFDMRVVEGALQLAGLWTGLFSAAVHHKPTAKVAEPI